ncbi:MAG: hypothetical protein ACOY94_16080 [Bacillota bacterium]
MAEATNWGLVLISAGVVIWGRGRVRRMAGAVLIVGLANLLYILWLRTQTATVIF